MAHLIKVVGSDQEMEGAYALRHQVFVEEQGVDPDLERDSLDRQAVHAVAVNSNMVVGTGRLIMDSPMSGVIGRMAVQAPLRRQGLGSRVLSFLEDEARSRGLRQITLHAQLYIGQFYTRHGYREEGTRFMEAGIQHIQMVKELV